MGLAQAWSVALLGVDGVPVEIEAHVGIGLPGFALVGLPDAALHESKERVRAAVLNSGEHWPNRRTTLALSPATLRKVGSSYDLALACAVLAADRAVPLSGLLGSTVLLGEQSSGRTYTDRDRQRLSLRGRLPRGIIHR